MRVASQLASPVYTAEQYKKNFAVHLAERWTLLFGENLLTYSQEVLIGLFQALGASPNTIGIAFGATKLNYLVQLFTARAVESKPQKKTFLVWAGLIFRLPFLLIPLTLWLFGTTHPKVALAVAIGGLWLHWVLNAVMNPPMMDLYRQTITNRSRFFSYKVIGGALIGTVAAFTVKWLFAELPFPTKYTVLFLVAFLFAIVSWVLFTKVLDNPPRAVPERCSFSLYRYVVSLFKLIPQDRTMVLFLAARTANEICFSWLFLTTLEYIQRFNLSDAALGNVMLFRFVPAVVVAYVAGRYSERFGPRQSMVIGAGALVLMWVVAIIASSPNIYLLVFLLMTVHLSIWSACEADAMLVIAPRDSVVAYKTVFLLIPNTIGALTAPIGGYLATSYGSNLVFMLAIVVSLISLGFFILVGYAKVPEEAEI